MATQASRSKKQRSRQQPNQVDNLFSIKKCPAFKSLIILIIGIITGNNIPIPIYIFLISFTFLLVILTFSQLKKLHPISHILLPITIFLAGVILIRNSNTYPHHHISQKIHDNLATFQGWICKNPQQKTNRTQLVLQCFFYKDSIAEPVSGKIMVYINGCPKDSFQYGDELIVYGRISKPPGRRNPGGFEFDTFLDQRGIHGVLRVQQNRYRLTGCEFGKSHLKELIYPTRRYISDTIEKYYSGHSQLLLKALLTGDRSEMPVHLYDQFSKSGIAHILAVSGLHVGFILIIFLGLFTALRIPYPARIILVICGLIFFTLITESRPSVIRASSMASFYLIGTLFERKPKPLNIIGLSALVSLGINPKTLFDLGFQLSYSAVLAIVIGYNLLGRLPFLKRWYARTVKKRLLNYMVTMVLVSLSALLGTLPLTVNYFNRISFLSIPINIIAIPLTGLTVILGFISLLLNLIHPGFIAFVAPINKLILSFIIWMAQLTSELPFSHVTCPTPGILHIISYFTFLALLLSWQNSHRRKKVLFLLLILINLCIFKNALLHRKPILKWIQFDVGYGDAALLVLPRGQHILIDSGAKHPDYDYGKRIIAPYLRQNGIKTLDAVFLSHAHNDHIAGLDHIINHFRVDQIFTPDTTFCADPLRNIISLANSSAIPLRQLSILDTIRYSGVQILCLSPGDMTKPKNILKRNHLNNQSLVLKVGYGKTSFLFMGDAEVEVEKELLRSNNNLKSNVLKIAHHGSQSSSITPFLKRINPEYAIISVGEHNRWGHPSQKVIERLKNLNIQVLRTDERGAVVIESDGESIQIIPWKNRKIKL